MYIGSVIIDSFQHLIPSHIIKIYNTSIQSYKKALDLLAKLNTHAFIVFDLDYFTPLPSNCTHHILKHICKATVKKQYENYNLKFDHGLMTTYYDKTYDDILSFISYLYANN